MQGLDTDVLTQLMQSISLHTQSSADTSERSTSSPTALQEGTPAQRGPGEGLSSEAGPGVGSGMAGQDLLADCPLPFKNKGSGAVARTPARTRRPVRKAQMTDDASDTESRVSPTVLRKPSHAVNAGHNFDNDDKEFCKNIDGSNDGDDWPTGGKP